MHFTFQLHQIFNYFSISKDFWQNLIKGFIHKSSKIKKIVQTRKIYAQAWNFLQKFSSWSLLYISDIFLDRRKKKQMNEDSIMMIKRNLVACVYLCRISFVRFWRRSRFHRGNGKAYVLKFAYRSARRCPCGRVLIKNSFILNSISSDYEQVVRAHIFWEKNSKKFHILYAMRRKEINKIDIWFD